MRRRLVGVLLTTSLLLSNPAFALPDYIPKPGGEFEGFIALEEPRSELPVGALWVEGYGPVGDGANADNLVTIRSLTGVTIDRNLQLGLLSGILKLFDISPSLRNRVSVRFNELSIVRVKDIGQLSGPKGEPRIYEALKAETLTITTDSNIGLNAQDNVYQTYPVIQRADIGRQSTYTIDARQMFIAFRVVKAIETTSEEQDAPIKWTGQKGTVAYGDWWIGIEAFEAPKDDQSPGNTEVSCLNPASLKLSVAKASLPRGTTTPTEMSKDGSAILGLPVPVADRKGGLFDRLAVRINLTKSGECLSAPPKKLTVRLMGNRLQALGNPKAPRW